MLETISKVLAALPILVGTLTALITLCQKRLELQSLNSKSGQYPIKISAVTLDQTHEPPLRLYRQTFLALAAFFLFMTVLNLWGMARGTAGAAFLAFFFALYTAGSLLLFRAFRGRRLDEPSGMYRSGQINVIGDFDSVFNCCKAALPLIGARIQYLDAARGYIVAHTGLAVRYLGEQIDVNVTASRESEWNIAVSSDSVLPPLGYDFGKNRSNIEVFIAGLLKECTLTKPSAIETAIEL
jgi:hypothetical protein